MELCGILEEIEARVRVHHVLHQRHQVGGRQRVLALGRREEGAATAAQHVHEPRGGVVAAVECSGGFSDV